MPPSSTTCEADTLLDVVRRSVHEHDMLSQGDRVLVGVSGGADSMALLHLLQALVPERGIQLGVAHLNHGLRGRAADQDAERVRHAADALGIPFHPGSARVERVKKGLGLSLEEAGRRVRHAFFHKIMAEHGYCKLALGHHLDDSAEQVLLALFRGAGPRGLSGIAPRRGHIIRPLIHLRRSAIAAYVENAGIPFGNDASNTDLGFVRNRIRLQLLPHLAATYNPQIHRHLDRLAGIMRDEDSWIESLVAPSFAAAVMERRDHTITLRADALRSAHPALARRLVRRAIHALCGSLQRVSFTHVAAILRLAGNGGGEKNLHLPGRLCVHRSGNRLTFKRVSGRGRIVPAPSPDHLPESAVFDLPFPSRIDLRTLGISLCFSHLCPTDVPAWQTVGRNRVFFDLDKLVPPLILRGSRPGDRFRPLGVQGTQTRKKFFSDHHVDPAERTRALVLADQRRIIWLLGLRMDSAAALTPETTRVLEVEFFLLDT